MHIIVNIKLQPFTQNSILAPAAMQSLSLHQISVQCNILNKLLEYLLSYLTTVQIMQCLQTVTNCQKNKHIWNDKTMSDTLCIALHLHEL